MGDPWTAACPSHELIGLLGSKWVLLVAPLLRNGPRRNNELMRALPGISQKMLTQTLRTLEQRQLVVRRDFGETRPRVEYELTRLGESLARAIAVLDDWVAHNYYRTVPAKAGESKSHRKASTARSPSARGAPR